MYKSGNWKPLLRMCKLLFSCSAKVSEWVKKILALFANKFSLAFFKCFTLLTFRSPTSRICISSNMGMQFCLNEKRQLMINMPPSVLIFSLSVYIYLIFSLYVATSRTLTHSEADNGYRMEMTFRWQRSLGFIFTYIHKQTNVWLHCLSN